MIHDVSSMAFSKYTQSEDHEVVADEERDAIRRVAGQRSADELAEVDREKLLIELEEARKQLLR
jgi:hypothetical protein